MLKQMIEGFMISLQLQHNPSLITDSLQLFTQPLFDLFHSALDLIYLILLICLSHFESLIRKNIAVNVLLGISLYDVLSVKQILLSNESRLISMRVSSAGKEAEEAKRHWGIVEAKKILIYHQFQCVCIC